MNAVPATPDDHDHWACEFQRLRPQLRRCKQRPRRERAPMVGVEVAYMALADWLAAGGDQPEPDAR